MTAHQLRRGPVRVLEADPDLGRPLSPRDFGVALDEAVAPLLELPAGVQDLSGRLQDQAGCLGWLLLDGMVLREITVDSATYVELVGQGDVLRGRDVRADEELVRHEVRCQTLAHTRVAFLDRSFASAAGKWPELMSALLDRSARRTARLAVASAVSNTTRVDARLIGALWLVAERWGRVTSDGVLLTVKLSHRTLGHLIGAQRPTVTKAFRELEEQGLLRRSADGRLVLAVPAERVGRLPAESHQRPAAHDSARPATRHAEIDERLRRAHELHELQAERLQRQAAALRDETAHLAERLRRAPRVKSGGGAESVRENGEP